MEHEQIVALGVEPISPDSRFGDPVRYDEIFEQLQAEMDKIGSLSGENPDWRRVIDLGFEIMKSKSKDLLVMTYMTIGLFENDGYKPLASALESYTGFIKNFWEGCFPKVKPPQGRYNAIQYLADKILPQIELKGGQAARNPTISEKEAVHKCLEHVTAFDEAVTAAFTAGQMPETPNLLPLKRAFKALVDKVGPLGQPAAAAPAEGAPSAEGAAAVPSEAPAASSGGLGGGGGVPDQFSSQTQAVQSIVKIAKYFMSQDDKDPRAYRLMRAAHWGALKAAPKDGLIPPPPAPRRQFFESTAAAGDWPKLLQEAEGQFNTTPLWLDMQRYVALAANNMGPMYKPVADAVVLELVGLVGRLPEIMNTQFKDNTTFADGATKAWFDEVGGSIGGGGGGGGSGGGGDALAAAVSEARKLMGAAKGPEAVALITQEIEGSASLRNQFRGQLALAEMCSDLNRAQLAASILEGLEAQIAEYRLHEWEPALAGQVYQNLYISLNKLKPKPTPEEQTRINAVFGALCRVDPEAAFKLDPSAKK